MPLVTFEASTNYAEIDGTKDPYFRSKIDWQQAANINDLDKREGRIFWPTRSFNCAAKLSHHQINFGDDPRMAARKFDRGGDAIDPPKDDRIFPPEK